MTDAELDEAVARECFGWVKRKDDVFLRDSVFDDPKTPDGPGVVFRPCENPWDAERVWDWLVKHAGGGVSINRWTGTDDSCVAIGSIRFGQRAPDWKRALCLAALEVARAAS